LWPAWPVARVRFFITTTLDSIRQSFRGLEQVEEIEQGLETD